MACAEETHQMNQLWPTKDCVTFYLLSAQPVSKSCCFLKTLYNH